MHHCLYCYLLKVKNATFKYFERKLSNDDYGREFNSTQLKFIANGSRMAKGIQYIKTTQMINVNEN